MYSMYSMYSTGTVQPIPEQLGWSKSSDSSQRPSCDGVLGALCGLLCCLQCLPSSFRLGRFGDVSSKHLRNSKHIHTFPRMISHDHIILLYFAILLSSPVAAGASSCVLHALWYEPQGESSGCGTRGTSPTVSLAGIAGLPRSKMKTLKGTSVAQASVERHLMREVGPPYSKCCWWAVMLWILQVLPGSLLSNTAGGLRRPRICWSLWWSFKQI